MIYLDNAATSYPKPEAVYKRVEKVLRDIGGNPGRSSHRLALMASRVVFGARESLSRLINISDSSRIVFTKNATEAVNIAFKGLLKKGDHVVTTSFEHNSVARTLRRLEKETDILVTRVKGKRAGLVEPSDIIKALTRKTKIVTIVHASNVFGTIQPVKEIGCELRKKGIIFMLDAAQTLGAMPTDVEDLNVDIIASTGHKALFGPQGTGLLYMREGIEPKPLVDGGTGEMDVSLDLPDRLESGTINTPGIGGLGAGVEFILKKGVSNIRSREAAMIEELLKGLKKIKGIAVLGTGSARERASLISFTIEGKPPEEAGMELDRKFSIMVRTGVHCAPDAHMAAGTYPAGAIRVSPGYFNTCEDVEKFLRAVTKIAKG